jgi:hypothetical protein
VNGARRRTFLRPGCSRRRLLGTVLAVTALAGCSAPAPESHGLHGRPFKPQSAIFADAADQTELLIWSTPDLCDFIETSSSLEFPYPERSIGILVLLDPRVSKLGKVKVDEDTEVIDVDRHCIFNGEGAGVGSSLTFDVVSATKLSGSFDVDEDDGAFDAARCDALFGTFPHQGKCH